MNVACFIRDYKSWLTGFTYDKEGGKHIRYSNLLNFLNEFEYLPFFNKDSNRSKDGISLRYQFYYEYTGEYNYPEWLDNGYCSMLEMLIALAIDIDDVLNDSSYSKVSDIFWDMIFNLNLQNFDDYNWNRNDVADIVMMFMNNEEGSLFGIDNQDLEIWQQAVIYISERS